MKRRLALVVQRYGEEVNGGAEVHARWLAERLQPLADVEVVTTCAVDYQTWEDVYPAGTTSVNGVTVHRFPIDQPRDWRRFRTLTGALLEGNPDLDAQLGWMRAQGPISTPLFNFLRRERDRFDGFLFMTYLYATTYLGLQLVADKSILIPTAHEEPTLHLALFRNWFHLPRVIVYNTATEQRLVARLTGNGHVASIVAGVGVNVPDRVDAAGWRARSGIDGPFVFYAGRIAESKNVPALLAQFAALRDGGGPRVKLLLAGRPSIPLPDHPDIIALGFISEADKFAAIHAASAVVVPSRFESLSLLTLEAWHMGTPVLVNGECEVLLDLCRQSNGGLYYTSEREFGPALTRLVEDAPLARRLGRQGSLFARTHYSWEVVLAKYERLLSDYFPTPAL